METPARPPPTEISHPGFPYFSLLPLELQIQIYKLLAHEPRIVKIHRKCVNIYLPPHGQLRSLTYLACHDPVPTVLHLCQTSRIEAKNIYSPAFSDGEGLGRYIWINFDTDTIKLTDCALMEAHRQYRARLRKVIMEVKDTYGGNLSEYSDAFSPMKNLTMLDIILEGKLEAWVGFVPRVGEWFEEWFENREGWVCPKVRVIEKATSIVIDDSNWEAMAGILDRERWEEVETRSLAARAAGRSTGGRGAYPDRRRG